MKPKVWLVQNGHLPKGSENKRGRLSLDNIEKIKAAVAKGAVIEGYSVSTAVTGITNDMSRPLKTEPVVTKHKASTEKEVIEPVPYRYPEDGYSAWEVREGKRVERSMRCACNGCGYSLVVCWCPKPRIAAHDGRGSVEVTIERKP